MQTTREKNAAWLPSESPRLAFGEPPPFGKGGLWSWLGCNAG